MIAKILGTTKDPFSVNVLENYARKYTFHPYISFNIRFYSITCHIKVLFGARNFFSVLFGGKSPFLSLVGPADWYMCCRADMNINSLRLRRRGLVFHDLLSNKM